MRCWGTQRALAHRRHGLRALRLRDGHAHLRRRVQHRHDRAAPRELRRLQARRAALRVALLAELSQRVVLAPAAPAPDQAALQRGLRRPRRPAAARRGLHARLQEAAAALRRVGAGGHARPVRGRRAGPLRRAGRELRATRRSSPSTTSTPSDGCSAEPLACSRCSTATAMVRQAWRIERWPVHDRPRARQRRGADRPARRAAPRDHRPRARGRGRRRRSLVVTAGDDEQRRARRPRAHRRRQRPDLRRRPAATSTCTSAAPRCACACPAMRSRPS